MKTVNNVGHYSEAGVNEFISLFGVNKALLENMSYFADAVWAIEMSSVSVYVFHDKTGLIGVGRKYSLEEIRSIIKKNNHVDEQEILKRLNIKAFEELKTTETYEECPFSVNGKRYALRMVITPEFDEQGNTRRIYVSFFDLQPDLDKENEKDNLLAENRTLSEENRSYSAKFEEQDKAYQKLMANMLDGSEQQISICKAKNYRLIYANEAVLKGFNKQGRLFTGKKCYEYFFGLKEPCSFCPIKEVKDTENEKRVEIYNDFTKRYYDVLIKRAKIGGEDVWIEYATDVTKNKEEVRAYERKLGTLKGTNIAMWNLLLGDGEPKLIADGKMEELVGVEKGTNPVEVYKIFKNNVPEESRSVVREYIDSLSAGKQREIVYRYKHPEKGIIIIRCGGIKDKNYEGPGILLRGYHQDITEQQNKFDEINGIARVLAKEYEKIYSINITNDCLSVLKPESGEVEEAFSRFKIKDSGDETVYSYSKIIEYHFDTSSVSEKEIMPNKQKFQIETVLSELKSRDEYLVDYRQKLGESIINKQARFLRLKDHNVIMAVRNIDEIIYKETLQRKMVENALAEAENANRSKTVFLNNMSHDIRTPMNAIIGFATLAEKHIDDRGRTLDYLKKINTSGNHLLELINDVLDMSRIEAGKIKLEASPFSVTEVVNDIKDIVKVDINKKNQIFNLKTVDIKEDAVVGDRLRLTQVLINCISNSIKFTPAYGCISLTVRQLENEGEDIKYEFRVKDSGIGMSKSFVNHIFEPFSREETSTVSGIQGTGLGMAITKNIVDMMRGKIEVLSEKGKGSEFIITLRFCEQTAAMKENNGLPSEGEETIDLDSKNLKGIKILLVEDNILNREIALDLLQEQGAVVNTAGDGSTALFMMEQAQEKQYDLILMDVQMPIMNGYEATRAIRAMKNKRKAGIPIVAMTANAFEEDKKRALEAGMNDHLPKPIDVTKMIKTIRKVLN